MRSLLLLVLLALPLTLTATGCGRGGGGGGGGDDDDDGGGSGGVSLWIRTLDSFDGQDEVRHSVKKTSYATTCSGIRSEQEFIESLGDAYDDGYDGVIDEFGDDEAPGAQAAICQLERTYYADIVAEDLPSLRTGAEEMSISLYAGSGALGTDLPPGSYLNGDDTDGDYYWGSRRRVEDAGWLADWAGVDCTDADEVEQQWDAGDSLLTYSDLENGIVWISAPSDSARGVVAEDVDEVDEDSGATSPFSLDEEFTLCEIDRRD